MLLAVSVLIILSEIYRRYSLCISHNHTWIIELIDRLSSSLVSFCNDCCLHTWLISILTSIARKQHQSITILYNIQRFAKVLGNRVRENCTEYNYIHIHYEIAQNHPFSVLFVTNASRILLIIINMERGVKELFLLKSPEIFEHHSISVFHSAIHSVPVRTKSQTNFAKSAYRPHFHRVTPNPIYGNKKKTFLKRLKYLDN